MRVILLILYGISSVITVLGQHISGQITDSNSQLPIAFVNIGIVGKNIGTVSDQEGKFRLSLTNALDTDTLRFSMISYKAIDFNLGELRKSEFPRFLQMDEKALQLQEVVISDRSNPSIQLGLEKKYCYPIPLYKGASSNVVFPQKNYRHEIGTRFINAKILSLDSIQLNFAECLVDILEIRLNVYSIKNEIIENILTKPIYISLSKEEALNFPIISLIKHQIEIESDFLITIENHKQIQNGALRILANFKSKGELYPTYYRHSSQGDWIKLKSSKSKIIGLSFLAFVH